MNQVQLWKHILGSEYPEILYYKSYWILFLKYNLNNIKFKFDFGSEIHFGTYLP